MTKSLFRFKVYFLNICFAVMAIYGVFFDKSNGLKGVVTFVVCMVCVFLAALVCCEKCKTTYFDMRFKGLLEELSTKKPAPLSVPKQCPVCGCERY